MVSPDHDVFFVREILNSFDISRIVARYREDGQGGKALNLWAMTELLAYA